MPAKPPNPQPSKLGQHLKTARMAIPLTQLQLAHKIGLKGRDAGAYISRLESGEQEPRLTRLQTLARVLRVPLEKLLNGGK